MQLPPTYYDFVRQDRPYLVELAELDAQELLDLPEPPTTIGSVDEYVSRFDVCMERTRHEALAPAAAQLGMTIEQLTPYLSSMDPESKAALAARYNQAGLEYHALVNFALSGKKTFYFSDHLAEHLANTEINLKAPLIDLPFPSCQFVFTARAAVNAMHNLRSDAGRWDINTAGLDYAAPISAFLTMRPASAGLPGRKLVICAMHARPPAHVHMMTKRELYLGEEWTLEQALRTDWEKLSPDNPGEGIAFSLEEGTLTGQNDDLFYTDGLAFYRLVLNAVLYLSSEAPELIARTSPHQEIQAKAMGLQSLSKRRKALQSMGRFSGLDYEEVGASVGAIVIQKGEAEGAAGAGGGKPLVRFMVRGHWRQQAHGVGRQARKLIWIRPFYKGPDLAEVINKPYLVK